MPRTATIDVAGTAIEAAWWNETATKTTIVLLHEGLGSVSLWRTFPAALATATNCTVFAYSRPGYGHSDPVTLPRPLTYMHDEAARLPLVLDAAGIGRAILLGHSDGASIAAIAAGSHYDPRIRGLVLIAPHFFTEAPGLQAIAATNAAYPGPKLRAALAKHHRDPDNAFRGWADAWLDPAFRAWRIDEFLPYIRLPILLIQSDADPYGTDAQLQIVADMAYGPVETLRLPGATHAPHLDHAAPVLAALADFTHRLTIHEPAL